jgi:hypothetical protein
MSEIHMEDLVDLDQLRIQDTAGASSLSSISDPTAMPFYKELDNPTWRTWINSTLRNSGGFFFISNL